MRGFLILIIGFLSVLSSQAEEGADLKVLLQDKAKELMKSPPINYEPNKYWFKHNGSVMDTPPHDSYIEVKNADLVTSNVSYLYFLNLSASTGYLQVRGGVADQVKWYGPFAIPDDLIQRMQSCNCIGKNNSHDAASKGGNK